MRLAVPSDPKTARLSRLVIAGLAVVGAGLFAVGAPTATGPVVQHRDVQLASTGEVDWTDFLTNTETSLANLQTEGTTAGTELSTALGNVSGVLDSQISNAVMGFETGINNALFGGWYGGDDGYVFGIFGGEPVTGADGTETGSLIQTLSNDFANISTNPNGAEQLYSDLNNYELELLDHTLKPLLAPLLDETSKGATMLSIPVELSQIQTNMLETFASYDELKNVAETVLSPEISGVFALSGDLDSISAAMTAGDSALATTDLENLGSDVLNAVVNGWVPPAGDESDLFPGLVGAGSFLDELYTTWTTQFITALGSLATESATTGASEAVGSSVPDLFSGLLSF